MVICLKCAMVRTGCSLELERDVNSSLCSRTVVYYSSILALGVCFISRSVSVLALLSISLPSCGTNRDDSSSFNDNLSPGEWVGNRKLNIGVGLGAVVVPASSLTTGCGNQSSITLLDGGVRTEAFAVLSSSGCTALLPPDDPTATSAVLVAPQVSCTFSLLEFQYVPCDTDQTFNQQRFFSV